VHEPWAGNPSRNLFVSLRLNDVADAILRTTADLEVLLDRRHEYPMWPAHGGNPTDPYEKAYCEPLRHAYYRSIFAVVRILRVLKSLE
jgi:hypothetical protein